MLLYASLTDNRSDMHENCKQIVTRDEMLQGICKSIQSELQSNHQNFIPHPSNALNQVEETYFISDRVHKSLL